MNEEYIELAANYGIDVSVPDRFYESQKLLLTEIMKHLQRLDNVSKPIRLHNERSNDCQLTGVTDLVGEIENMIKELEAEDKKVVSDVINYGSGFMKDGKHIPLQDVLNSSVFDDEIKSTDLTFFESLVKERTEQDELKVVAEKIKAGHELFKKKTKPCMKCGVPVDKYSPFAECFVCNKITTNRIRFKTLLLAEHLSTGTPQTITGEQMVQANKKLDEQLERFTYKLKPKLWPTNTWKCTKCGSTYLFADRYNHTCDSNEEEHF